MRLDYKIDSPNSIFIIPNLSFQNNKSTSIFCTKFLWVEWFYQYIEQYHRIRQEWL